MNIYMNTYTRRFMTLFILETLITLNTIILVLILYSVTCFNYDIFKICFLCLELRFLQFYSYNFVTNIKLNIP